MATPIADLIAQGPTFSFEFFPPKSDEAVESLVGRAAELAALRPSFVSVTYGAGGSTRDRTRDLVVRLRNQVRLNAAAHLTCVGHSRGELVTLLNHYRQQGVRNIVALRGDAPDPHGRRNGWHPSRESCGHHQGAIPRPTRARVLRVDRVHDPPPAR